MSKQKPSKLDPFAERLTQWFTPKDKGGDGLTLAAAQAQLKLDGCSVSPARLSLWWAARQQEFLRDTLLGQIASGARQCGGGEIICQKSGAGAGDADKTSARDSAEPVHTGERGPVAAGPDRQFVQGG